MEQNESVYKPLLNADENRQQASYTKKQSNVKSKNVTDKKAKTSRETYEEDENESNEEAVSTFYYNIIRTNLRLFIQQSFETLCPSTEFLDNWHIDAITHYLSAMEKKEISRLIINIPPRYLKSLSVNVAWPAWLLGQNPSCKIISASYSQILANKHSIDTRNILLSEWYKKIFPAVVPLSTSQNTKNKFQTTQHGFRLATSVGGTLTGEGADFLIVDDPMKPQDAYSKKARYKVIDWFENTFMTRLNDRKCGVIVIMQRLHANDLTGHILSKANPDWEHLVLPISPNKKHIINIVGEKFHRKKDEPLHPERHSKSDIEQIKKEVGSTVFASQYQQQPVCEENSIIKKSWIHYCDKLPESTNVQTILSWDTAIKKNGDFSACSAWKIIDHKLYLFEVIRKQVEYLDLLKLITETANRLSPNAILVENKSSGQQIVQHLNRTTSLPVIPIQPTQDKISRLYQTLPMFESGQVYVLKNQDWLEELEGELLGFPHVEHDDQVDSISQFLQWVLTKNYLYKDANENNFSVRML